MGCRVKSIIGGGGEGVGPHILSNPGPLCMPGDADVINNKLRNVDIKIISTLITVNSSLLLILEIQLIMLKKYSVRYKSYLLKKSLLITIKEEYLHYIYFS